MSQCTSADESWLDPMTQLTGQQLGHSDITLHLHHHGDTSIPHERGSGSVIRRTFGGFSQKKKSKPLTRQQLWGMWILSLCFWKKYNLTLNHSRFVCFLCQLENASTSSVAHWVYFCHHKARGFLHSHTISFKPLSVRVMSLLYQH